MLRHSATTGRAELSLEEIDVAVTAAAEVIEKLRAAFTNPSYSPPVLPAAAVELMQLSQKPDVSFAEVRRVMERDPMIAASVLRMAQSSAYTTAGAVRTLDEALVRLGLRTLGHFFIEAAVKMKVFRAPGYDAPMKELARHSSAAAHLSRHIARRTPALDEYSFLCGLLHDIGIAAGLIAIASDTPKKGGVRPLHEIWPAVLDAHEMASEIVCRAWGLPSDVALVAGHHHECAIGGQIHPVAAVVAVADWVSFELGYGLHESTIAPDERILRTLGLTSRELPALLVECKPVLEGISHG